ncbi:MAG: tRNA adenosine(34) deaminase TadA [Burkholderiaceae bacterium]|nr:tRNA adenosine(34) deaminase TadA [Burkholderiaceae bacterium]
MSGNRDTPEALGVVIASDAQGIELALSQARATLDAGEVPVGAVLADAQGRVIATGCNAPVAAHDPTAHAEIQALRAAAAQRGNYRLDGCTLYVTLEPCAMCAGAILHARLARVVYGARDPKAGAAGSVLDVLGDARLNHQTTVTSGVLAQPCGALLRDFFRPRRVNLDPLREDALRTPDAAFAPFVDTPAWPWPPCYVANLPALAGLRLHYIDTGPADAPLIWLLLHDGAAWGWQFRHFIALLAAGHRVVAPDLIGFGRSDKPKREDAHSFVWHRQALCELIERLDLRRVVLAGCGLGARLAQTVPLAMGGASEERYRGLLMLNAQPGCAPDAKNLRAGSAYAAPFPDAGHRAALRAAPRLWQESESLLCAAHTFWRDAPLLTETADLESPEQMRALAECALRHFAPTDAPATPTEHDPSH